MSNLPIYTQRPIATHSKYAPLYGMGLVTGHAAPSKRVSLTESFVLKAGGQLLKI